MMVLEMQFPVQTYIFDKKFDGEHQAYQYREEQFDCIEDWILKEILEVSSDYHRSEQRPK